MTSSRLTHKARGSSVFSVTVCDSDLFFRWRDGDVSALEAMMRRHVAAVRAVALAIAADPDDADDVCQETFVRSWERRAQCRRPERFQSWLLSIARNEALTRRRRERRRIVLHDQGALEARQEETDGAVARSELRRHLAAGLSALPEPKGVVLILRDLEGWPHREVAEYLGISEAMSRRHLSDARKLMRAHLSRKGVWNERIG